MQGGGQGGGGGGEEGGGCGGGAVLRKGPWMVEEDEILMEYVRKHGPRDWSSIRSKGLLPRTGKSCRLRWVNKLKPDLKTGCKFSPEEERVVIDLQAKFGNKWARIATYLPGRTDNDVKNFWSTRQKRLARILQTPLPTKSSKRRRKSPVNSQETPALEGPNADPIPFDEDPSQGQCNGGSYFATPNAALHDMGLTEDMLSLDASLPLLEPTREPLPIAQLPMLLLPDIPLLRDGPPEIIPGFADMSFLDDFARPEASQCSTFPEGIPFFAVEDGHEGVNRESGEPGTPDSFFNDFPTDMFDYLEDPPASSSPP